MKFFTELADVFRYTFRMSATEKQVIVYVEHGGFWPNVQGLVQELIARGQKVIYITSDPNDPILTCHDDDVRPLYIRKLLPVFMFFVNCHVFVMTLTELDQHHIKRSINSVHYVYMFHSMVSVHMGYAKGSFSAYDSVLCVGPYMEAELRALEKVDRTPTKQLRLGGYFRLERIRDRYAVWRANNPPQPGKSIVLVAPSWGNQNVLKSCGVELVEGLLDDGHDVIVRPHPETLRRDPALIADLEERFGKRPDFLLERSVATDDSLLQADVMICDASGVALEYAFGTERPVLFLDVPLKVRDPDFERIGTTPIEVRLRTEIGVVVPADDIVVICGEIRHLLEQNDTYREAIRAARAELIYDARPSGEIAADHVLQLLADRPTLVAPKV